MAKIKCETIDTGIYQEVRYTSGNLLDEEHPSKVWRQIEWLGGAELTFEDRLSVMASHASRLAGNLETPEPQREDALEVLFYAKCLENQIQAGDVKTAALIALHLGRIYERMTIRPAEPAVKRVKTTTKALRAGAKARCHPPEQITEAVALYHKLVKLHPTWKKSKVEKEVQDKTGIPPRTLRYHLSKGE